MANKTTINLIAGHIPKEELKDVAKLNIYKNKACCVTGLLTDCYERKYLLKASFTTQDILKAPDSNYVSPDAFQALRYKWERCSSWVASEKSFDRLDRQGVRMAVLHGVKVKSPWSGYATTSYKKHGALLTPVNANNKAFWVFETKLVDCTNRKSSQSIYNKLVDYLKKGFGRSILEKLDCPPFVMSKVGINEWLELEKWAKPIFKSNLYQFLCYLLPSQQELKEELKKEESKYKKREQLELW